MCAKEAGLRTEEEALEADEAAQLRPDDLEPVVPDVQLRQRRRDRAQPAPRLDLVLREEELLEVRQVLGRERLRLLEGEGVVGEVEVGEVGAERQPAPDLLDAIPLQVQRLQRRQALQPLDRAVQAIVAQLQPRERGRGGEAADVAEAAVVELELEQPGVQQPRRLDPDGHVRVGHHDALGLLRLGLGLRHRAQPDRRLGGGPLDGHPVRRLLRAALPVQRALRRHREAGHRAAGRELD